MALLKQNRQWEAKSFNTKNFPNPKNSRFGRSEPGCRGGGRGRGRGRERARERRSWRPKLVGETGLEPARVSPRGPKPRASAISPLARVAWLELPPIFL